MKRTILVALSSVVLASCADWHAWRGYSWAKPDPNHPRVWVVPAGANQKPVVVVDQEPIYIKQHSSNTITWSLNPRGEYYFPSDQQRRAGIEFIATDRYPKLMHVKCGRGTTRYEYVCTYPRVLDTKSRPKHHYIIRVTSNDIDIIDSDPTMMND